MSNQYRLWATCFLFNCLVLLCNPFVVTAAPSTQTGTVTLTISNESDQTICYVYISAVTADNWGEDLLGDDTIPPRRIYRFSIASGDYDVRMKDCNDSVLLEKRQLAIYRNYELALMQTDVTSPACAAYNQQGKQAYRSGLHEEALAAFQTALNCYHEAGDRTNEGAILNNMGVVYDTQGHYQAALMSYQQALKIAQEMGERASEGDTLNNIATMYAYQGRYDEALKNYEQALSILRELEDRSGEGRSLNGIGGVYQAQGLYDKALDNFEQTLVIRREVDDQEGEGITLSNIGAIYQAQGRYSKALENYQQAVKIQQKIGDQLGEGTTLTNIGGIYDSQGRYVEALASFKRALVILQKVGDIRSVGIVLNNLGGVYQELGQYNEALENFQQALAILKEVGAQDNLGDTIGNIGLVYHKQGRYQKALESFQEALKIAQDIGNQAGIGKIVNNIGLVYESQGQYAAALEKFVQAYESFRVIGDRSGKGTSLNNIAAVYEAQGWYEKALDSYQQSLAIQRAIGNLTGQGTALNNIGKVYYAQGQYSKALESYKQALALRHEVGDYAGEGATLNNIGTVYHVQGQYDEALSSYKQAIVIAQKIDNWAGVSDTLNNVAGIYHIAGKYEEALKSYEEALEIAQQIGDQAGIGVTFGNIGEVYRSWQQYDQALDNYKQALTILRKTGNRTAESLTLSNIGLVYESKQQYQDALHYYLDSIDLLESIRSTAGSDQARTNFIEHYIAIYDHVIALYFKQGAVDQALWYSERGRARTLLDLLTTGQVQLSDNETAALLAAEQEAYAVHQSAQDALAKARAANPPDPAWVNEAEQALKDAEAAYQNVSDEIAARSGQLASLIPGRQKVLKLAEVQALLDRNTTLLSYWMLEGKTLAFVVTAKDAKIVELPQVTSQIVLSATESLHKWTNKDNPAPLPLRELYQALVAPLADKLKTSHVAIIPHQSLHYVPFAALTDGEQYFGQQHLLTVLPSASVLPFLAQNAANAKHTASPTALVFGNPQTDLPALPAAEAEASAVAELFQTTVYTGAAASETQLRTSIQHANIVHLAAHGNYNMANPLYSAIALASGEGQDGLLETQEIFGLPLEGNNLVVLSACETTVNDLAQENRVALSRGDELVSLTRAFFFAGTPTVISSLWSVDDAATEKLMVSFYTHWLQDGMSKAEALQAAQADVRSDPRWASPFYWAGFVLNGHPGEAMAK